MHIYRKKRLYHMADSRPRRRQEAFRYNIYGSRRQTSYLISTGYMNKGKAALLRISPNVDHDPAVQVGIKAPEAPAGDLKPKPKVPVEEAVPEMKETPEEKEAPASEAKEPEARLRKSSRQRRKPGSRMEKPAGIPEEKPPVKDVPIKEAV